MQPLQKPAPKYNLSNLFVQFFVHSASKVDFGTHR